MKDGAAPGLSGSRVYKLRIAAADSLSGDPLANIARTGIDLDALCLTGAKKEHHFAVDEFYLIQI